jgi:tetraacyldisaccharide 4'-kinase
MKKNLENYFLDIITKKQRGVGASMLRGVLLVLSFPYRFVVHCRNWAFDNGWFRRYSPPVPIVISVGNIVVGGTGKTPVTLMLAQEFYERHRIAVLSRGYRSVAEKLRGPTVLCDGHGPKQSAAHCGDEPFLLAQNLPKAIVIVGHNRHLASNMAARAGAELILLDDGMQHRHLARDFEVVVMDTTDPFGQGYFLPRGLLREGVKSLSRAHLVILNHVKDNESFEELRKEVQKYTTAPVVGTRMDLVSVVDMAGEPAGTLQDKKLGIFCGIAHPEYFYNTIIQHGGIIVDTAYAADHRTFDAHVLREFAAACKAKGADMLVCTEKDIVKIEDLIDMPLPVTWVKMKLSIVEGYDEWRKFIEEINSGLAHPLAPTSSP